MFIFCPHCGERCDDGERFCHACGAPLPFSEDSENSENPEISVNSENAQNGGETSNTQYAENAPQTDGAPRENLGNTYRGVGEMPGAFYAESGNYDFKPKKRVKRAVLISVSAVLALAITVCAVFFPYVSNFLKKTFMSNEKYFQSVLSAGINSSAADFSKSYAEYIDAAWDKDAKTPTGYDVSLSLEAGDFLMNFLGGAAGVDLSWLKSFSGEVSVGMPGDDGVFGEGVKLLLNNTELITIAAVIDPRLSKMYFAFPELSEKYISLDSPAAEYFADIPTDFGGLSGELLNEKPDFLPSGEELRGMLIRYSGAALAAIDDVDKGAEALSVGDMSKNCTVLTANIDSADVRKMLENIVSEMKNDDTLRDVVNGAMEYISEISGQTVEEDYDGLCSKLEKELAESEPDGGDVLTLKVWVDAMGNIVGTEAEVADGAKIAFYEIKKGNSFSLEAVLDATGKRSDKLTLEGSGKNTGNDLSMECSLKLGSREILKADIENLPLDSRDDGVGAKIVITPGKYVNELISSTLNLIGSMSDSDLSVFSESFDMSLTLEKTQKDTFDLSLVVGGEENPIAALRCGVSVKYDDGVAAKVPSDEDIIEYDSDEAKEWANSLDDGMLGEKLKKAGVPEEYVGTADGLMSSILGSLKSFVDGEDTGYGDYDGYDGYDDYDWYDDDYDY